MPLAIGIAASPFPILPAILLLFTRRPRLTSLSYLLGWLIGLVAVTAAFVLLAEALPAPRDEAPRWASWVRIALGATLVVLGVRGWLARKTKTPAAWVQSLQSANPGKAVGIGLLLSAVNPKSALLAAAAGLAIAGQVSSPRSAAGAIVGFTLIASLGVGMPVLLYALIGEPVRRPLGKAKDWLERNNAAATAEVMAVIGCVLIVKGARALA